MKKEVSRIDIGRRDMILGGKALAASTGLVGNAVAQPRIKPQRTDGQTTEHRHVNDRYRLERLWLLFRRRRGTWA
jgi:hypothetical protein